MDRSVIVVQTGTANTASVLAGLRRAGALPELALTPGDIESAGRVVLPGVGALGAAMQRLEADGTADALRRRMNDGRPTLAICLGLQLLATGSEESPDTPGLGVLPVQVRRLPADMPVPQMGWNSIDCEPGCRLLRPGHAYFANSYALDQLPDGWTGAWFDHGRRFIAAVEKDGVLACQFHPELSGGWGLDLLRRWLEQTAERTAAC
jgi:glutamine amidotransferase